MRNQVSREVRLSSLMDGAADVLFADAFAEVLKNVEDPNADPKAKRKIVLTITVKPNEKRSDAALEMDCKTKLAALKPISSVALLGHSDGEFAAVEVCAQEDLFEPTKPAKRMSVVDGGEKGAH